MKPILIAAAAVLVAASASAATYRLGAIEVGQAWSRPAVSGTNGIGYMTVANRGKAADTLLRVESPVAGKVEMHSMTMAGGVMSMARQNRIAIPAGGQVIFGPGGYHLMLLGLTKTTAVGDEIPATLTFASGARLKVAFAVGMGATAAASKSDGMEHMQH